jgi:HAD superfamily hydrolase (TIGR01509 family)
MALGLVIFDLDGTLVEPALDFDAIKREIGLPADQPILEAMEGLDEAARGGANRILDRHEEEAAARSRLMPGARRLLAWLRRRGIRVAVLTRNSRTSVRRAARRHRLRFDAVVAREDKKPKPSPDGVRHLMAACGAGPDETVVVGDYRFDVEAGAAAGCRTVALVAPPAPPWAARATWQAGALAEVQSILERALV